MGYMLVVLSVYNMCVVCFVFVHILMVYSDTLRSTGQ